MSAQQRELLGRVVEVQRIDVPAQRVGRLDERGVGNVVAAEDDRVDRAGMRAHDSRMLRRAPGRVKKPAGLVVGQLDLSDGVC